MQRKCTVIITCQKVTSLAQLKENMSYIPSLISAPSMRASNMDTKISDSGLNIGA